jgi:hypothetical protein
MTRLLSVLGAVACLATAPVVARAQEPAPSHQASAAAGPRLRAEFKTYHPKLVQEEESAAASAAADKTTITISTLGLVLIIVLLIVLIA